MKKLFAALLTLCMVFGMAVPAFAAGDPLTIRFYYGGADYGRYKEGWIDVGNIDTGAGRFYARCKRRTHSTDSENAQINLRVGKSGGEKPKHHPKLRNKEP